MACFYLQPASLSYLPDENKYKLNLDPFAEGERVYRPCGKCAGCRADQANQWAIRCQLEAMSYPGKNWFCTFTYDDEHLPLVDVYSFDEESGEVIDSSSVPNLSKREWQLFVKRLRKRFGDGIRYLSCGEYGEITGRSHYHAVFFNLDLTGIKLERYTVKSGAVYYKCADLEQIWSKGQVLICPYEYATGAYVAKYLQKRDFRFSPGFVDTREKPFLLMSRRPGLARPYYDAHIDHITEFDRVVLPGADGRGAYSVTSPHYFDYLLRQDESRLNDLFTNKAIRRERMRMSMDSEELRTDRPLARRMEAAEEAFLNRKKVRT